MPTFKVVLVALHSNDLHVFRTLFMKCIIDKFVNYRVCMVLTAMVSKTSEIKLPHFLDNQKHYISFTRVTLNNFIN